MQVFLNLEIIRRGDRMKGSYEDIRKRIKEEPKWYDMNGVPRYCDFSPSESPNIYADEVALVEIECQGCGKKFLVELNWDEMCDVDSLSKRLKKGTLGYGDPPNHGCVGDTMSSYLIKVVQFWKRDTKEMEWVRVKELEGKVEE